MQYSNPNPKFFYVGVLFMAVFCSCNKTIYKTTLKASIDFTKTHEDGPSRIEYNTKTGENAIIYDEYDFGDDAPWGEESRESDSSVSSMPTSGFGIGAGLEFIAKGAKSQQGDGTLGLNYLEIPIHLLYHYPLSYGNLYAGFGPYFAYGVGGKIKSEGFSESSFGENNGGYKRFDFGLGLMAGYKLPSGFSLDVAYEYGLANIAYSSEDVTSHNRCFSINVGYQIGLLFKK